MSERTLIPLESTRGYQTLTLFRTLGLRSMQYRNCAPADLEIPNYLGVYEETVGPNQHKNSSHKSSRFFKFFLAKIIDQEDTARIKILFALLIPSHGLRKTVKNDSWI